MKYRLSMLVALIVSPALVLAQSSQKPSSFTLDDCIKYALENSVDIKNATIDEEIADARVKETRGIGLPQVDATVGLLHNQKLPRFFLQKSPSNPFAADLPGNEGDVYAMENFFQLKSSGNAQVSVSQILFDGSYLVGLRAANAYRELSVRSTKRTKEETVQNVTKAFYAVLINKDRMELFDNNIARVDSLLKTTEALQRNGFAESIEVDRIRVTLNNLVAERDK